MMFKKNNYQFVNLCLNFETLSKKENSKIVLITSGNLKEGKTTISVNITRQLVEEGKRVLIIDADPEYQDLSAMLNTQGRPGFLDLLREGELNKLELYILNTQISGLEILPIGNINGNNFFFEFDEFFEHLKMISKKYDYVIFDSSTLDNPITRNLVINCDGTILVARQNDTLKEDMVLTQKTIDELNGKILGWILNAVK